MHYNIYHSIEVDCISYLEKAIVLKNRVNRFGQERNTISEDQMLENFIGYKNILKASILVFFSKKCKFG